MKDAKTKVEYAQLDLMLFGRDGRVLPRPWVAVSVDRRTRKILSCKIVEGQEAIKLGIPALYAPAPSPYFKAVCERLMRRIESGIRRGFFEKKEP